MCIISIVAALVIDFTAVERAFLICLGMLVLATELMNTAVEAVVDRISEEENPLSKKAKDAACASVTVVALSAAVAWLVLLFA